jgi:tRNA dimethylallyltransferase
LRRRVPHHGLDLRDPDEEYSAGRFASDAWRWIGETGRRGQVPIIAGGTGFFLRALLAPLGPEPELDTERKARLRRYLSGVTVHDLQAWLARLDPRRSAELGDQGGRQRLARSLEVTLLSGRAHSWWLERAPETEALAALVFCLDLDRKTLYERIDQRFDRMMAGGLLDEARGLWDGYPSDAPGLKSVGYAELAEHLRGERSLEAAVEQAKRNTHRLAKRQLTWFRHQLPDDTVRLDASRPRDELAAEVVRQWHDAPAPNSLKT